jgi:hypothetical protein
VNAIPFKEWTIELDDARIYIWRHTQAGVVISFAVVLIAWTGDEWECVTRYDCAHGFPHRDVLGKQAGLLYKQTFPGFTLEQLLHHAIRDCQKNCEKHIGFFASH